MSTIKNFSGSARHCGALYCKYYQREIAGFYSQEFGTYKYSPLFVESCWDAIKSEAPHAAMFIEGATRLSLLSREQHTLLLLHEEELYHRKLSKKVPHCSAVGIVNSIENSRGTLVGQNWDWNTAYYPWLSLNRFSITGKPRILSLSFPGLPVCAGLNSSGLSLMWSGSGYYPALDPCKGVPTYALVFETLLKEDVASALDYLKSITASGAFIFLLGDKEGNLAIVEGVPGKIFIQQSNAFHRSNIYEIPEVIKASRQKLPRTTRCHSILRNEKFNRTFPRVRKNPTLENVKSILSKPDILIERGFSHATLIQLVADCKRKELHVRRWRQKQNSWVRVRV